ncbi:MAG: hypothetical protein HUK03_01535 [Bacteroidaceae bacterium]|nr:hypothetical protein [Bacteroidaceae bacterium]
MDGVEGEPTTTHVYAKFKTNNPYQLLNSDFEVWNSKGNEPAPGWNSFESATGSLAGIGKSFAPQPSQVEGRSGNAVKLISKNAMGANANGNLTTGYVNMGSATPSSTDNHNYTDTESKGHYMIIKGQPDAVELWTKFTASSGNQSKAGNAKFIIHDKYNYKDPEAADPQETSHRIATSNVVITESTEWTRHEAAFTYDWSVEAAAATDKYVLANITTNGVPGESAGDELIVDDVRLIYYSEIDSATYKGTCFTFGDGSEYGVDGFATVNDEYDESQLVLYCNGRGAKITKDFYPDENMLLITVEGNDIEWNETNVHYYAIQFSDAQETITTLSSPITINVNGITLDPTNIEFKFIQKGSKYSLRMENFMLDGNGIGTIVLNDITYNEGHISTTQTITIEPGTDPGVQSWIGPFLGPVPIVMNGDVDVANETMTAKIDIDMSGTIGQIVQVIAAPVNAMSDTEMIGTGLQNVKFDREFQRNGWSTICLPFAWSNAGFGGSTYEVQAFDSANDGVLTFKKVAEKDGTPVTLEANKPYLIYLDNNANDAPYYFGAEVASTTPIGDTKSGVTFIGNYEAGKSMDGLYGAVIKDGVSRILKGDASSSISIGRAYFEVAAGVEINGSRIDLEGHEGETSIDGVEMLNANAPIYNIQGIRDNATRHGIYIQNGKKFVK